MEIETDKATVEVEAPASGTPVDVSTRPGDEFPVGQIGSKFSLLIGRLTELSRDLYNTLYHI